MRILEKSLIKEVKLKLSNIEWVELADFLEPEFLIKNPSYERFDNQGYSKLTATLENRSNYDFEKIDISAVLFSDSKILAVGKTSVETIMSGERRYFEIHWFYPVKEKIEQIKIKTETNVFLDENFMRRYQEEREKFQEY